VDGVDRYVIPTLSKAKISHDLSYPIGAEKITAALDGVGRMVDLKLHFCHGTDMYLRRGDYEFLRIEYLCVPNGMEQRPWPTYGLYYRPPQNRWEIVVQAVPRVYRHKIKEYIQAAALLSIRQWLEERDGLVRTGRDLENGLVYCHVRDRA
jgi:hypothetical protein